MVQKFVPRSVVGIFRNKRTCSSPLDPKLMCLVHFVQFWCIWDRLVDLRNSVQNGPNWYKSSWYEVASKFFETNAPDHPLDPKLMFWSISYNFGALGTVWLTYETRCKTGRTSAKVRATKSRRNFSQPMHPIHPIGP